MEKIIIDCSTNEKTIVPLTAEEIAEQEAALAQFEAEQAALAEAAAAVAEAKASAEAKLAALGLTPEEIAALSK